MKRIHHLPSLTFLVIHGKSSTYVFNYRTLSLTQRKRTSYDYSLCQECKQILQENNETCSELEVWSLMQQCLRFQLNYDMTRIRVITPGSNLKHQFIEKNKVFLKYDLGSIGRDFAILGTHHVLLMKPDKSVMFNLKTMTKKAIKFSKQSWTRNHYTHIGYFSGDWWGFYQKERDHYVAEKLDVDRNTFLPVCCPFDQRYIFTNFNYNCSMTHSRLRTKKRGRISYGTHTHHS